ncbi:MAG: RsmE family RNA methyltransferase [Chloroflexi bacterium]|nr:RsmE family RNA methyltransferase [Chloroflexota bacterium]
MHRFFVTSQSIHEGKANVDGPVARQAARVLRLQTGDSVVLMDNSGCEYVVVLHGISPSRLEGEVVEERRGLGNPGVMLTLYQGVLKGDKFETVLQKGTEIGISTFVPVLCRRSIPRASKGWADGRHPRWQSILTEATEQSGRACIPTLKPLVSLKEALTEASGVRLMAWEKETEMGFRETLVDNMERVKAEGLSFLVGPEGGFDPEEVEEARDAGVVPVSLGQRILRGETAGLAMAAAVMYQMGEMGR